MRSPRRKAPTTHAPWISGLWWWVKTFFLNSSGGRNHWKLQEHWLFILLLQSLCRRFGFFHVVSVRSPKKTRQRLGYCSYDGTGWCHPFLQHLFLVFGIVTGYEKNSQHLTPFQKLIDWSGMIISPAVLILVIQQHHHHGHPIRISPPLFYYYQHSIGLFKGKSWNIYSKTLCLPSI